MKSQKIYFWRELFSVLRKWVDINPAQEFRYSHFFLKRTFCLVHFRHTSDFYDLRYRTVLILAHWASECENVLVADQKMTDESCTVIGIMELIRRSCVHAGSLVQICYLIFLPLDVLCETIGWWAFASATTARTTSTLPRRAPASGQTSSPSTRQCSGSESRSTGSTCFWASRIRIH